MANTTNRVILVQTVDGGFRELHSLPAAVAITPGSLVEVTTSDTLTPIASANKINFKVFAVESLPTTDYNAAAIDTVIPVGEAARHIYATRGDVVLARLTVSQTVAKNDLLVSSATAGCLQKAAAEDATLIAGAAVGRALEAVTTDGSTISRIKVRVL